MKELCWHINMLAYVKLPDQGFTVIIETICMFNTDILEAS